MILQVILLNIPETFFIFCYVSLNYTKRTKILSKDIITIILIAIMSNLVQTTGIPTLLKNTCGIFLYYIIFRILYKSSMGRLKLLKTILISFILLLFIQITTYTPLILFLDFSMSLIHHNILYMFLSRIPIDFICLLILLFKKERIDYNESR